MTARMGPQFVRNTPERTLQGRYYSGDEAMEWANVVLDLRSNPEDDEPLLHEFPAPGIYGKGGVFVLPAERGYPDTDPCMGRTAITWHALCATGSPVYAVKVTYGDGWSAAYVSRAWSVTTADPFALPENTLRKYMDRSEDGLAQLLRRADGGESVSRNQRLNGAARTYVDGFRAAMSDPVRWLATWDPASIGDPVRDLVHYSSYGVPDHRSAQTLSKQFSYESQAHACVLAGFDMREAEDREWVGAFADKRTYWLGQHRGKWAEAFRLQREGWTLPALRVLHANTGLTASVGRGDWDEAANVVAWLQLLNTPEDASAYIAAGIGYAEAHALINSGDRPDEDTLNMLAALRHDTSR